MSTAPTDLELIANELVETSLLRCREKSLPLSSLLDFINASHQAEEIRQRAREIADDYQRRRTSNPSAMVDEDWHQQIDVHDKNGKAWKRLVTNLQRDTASISDEARVDQLWREAKSVTDLLPHPTKQEDGRGLVMGFVQSGKTANFTAVIAQAVDVGYDLIIVLTGGSKTLRAQTHARMWGDLENDLNGIEHDFDDDDAYWSFLPYVEEIGTYAAWKPLCESDIRRGERPDVLKHKPVIIIAKKNGTVLTQLNRLVEKARKQFMTKRAILIIDDEADQASPSAKKDIEDARTINMRIRTLLDTCRPATYVGYTATPYANVFIDRDNEGDLFPRTFIKPIDHGEGYFGAKEFFGSNEEALVPAADFVNIIEPSLVNELSPPATRGAGTWTPTWNDAICDAVLWFLMATAVRRLRDGEPHHSSMLVHTGFNVASHRRLCSLIRERVKTILQTVPEERMRELYTNETAAVPAGAFGYEEVAYADVRAKLDAIIEECQVVMDNSESEERLDYSTSSAQVVIAVGGNTLSRGLTLEGLVCSLFVRRSTNAYDTLMQMGRWFGYRRGYEDLPRLWTTAELMSRFRKIADVEADLRETIEQGVSDGLTPAEMQIEIVKHPGMQITSKMGAAKLQVGLETLGTGQPSYPKAFSGKATDLTRNLTALRHLVVDAKETDADSRGSHLLRNVETASVKDFLGTFTFAPDDDLGRFDPARQLRYLEQSELTDGPLSWNVVIVDNPSGRPEWGIELGLGKPIIPVQRGQEAGSADGIVRFQGILSKSQMVTDLAELAPHEAPANWIKAAEMRRNQLGDGVGLLLIYVIYAKSKTDSKRERGKSLVDLDLPENLVAPVVVFPYKPRATRKMVAAQ